MKRAFRDLPLGRKLATALAITGGVTLLLACGAFVTAEVRLFRQELVVAQTTGARVLAANSTAVLAFEDPEGAAEVLSALRQDARVKAAALYDREGRIFASYPTGSDAPSLPPAPEDAGHRFTPASLAIFEPVVQGQRRLGTLYVETDLSAIRERLVLYGWIVLGVIVGAAIVALLIAVRLQRILLKPILGLADSARAVTERNDFLIRVEPEGDDEVGALTKAFNAMLARIHVSGLALRESEDRFRTMANSMPQLAWIARADGYVYWYNQRWFDYTGTTHEQMEGRGWTSVHHPSRLQSVVKRWEASLASGEDFDSEFPLRGADGRYRRFLTRAVAQRDGAGRVVRWFGTNTDVEDLRVAEQKVRQLNDELELRVVERTNQLEAVNKELEAFGYSVSHDLRAPLRHIVGFVSLLEESVDGRLGEDEHHYLEVISAAAQRMGRLIDDLLAFSRMGREELRKESVDLEALVTETIEELEHDLAGRNVRWHRSALPEVNGDRQMLRQVFANLIGNAIKYTRPRDPAEIRIGAEVGPGGETIVYVRDNGVGFDMKYVDKLFGVFQRLHSNQDFEGTGIGLANVRRIIARHGGRTWAEAQVGEGATFYLSLPITSSNARS